MTHKDTDGNRINLGDRVELALNEGMGTSWGEMIVTDLVGKQTVIVKRISPMQVPAYQASHLKLVTASDAPHPTGAAP